MDIDFITDLSGGFSISIGDNPIAVSGNRALVNRFEITFLTKTRTFLFGESDIVVDNFGGNAYKFINKPQVLNNMQSIAAAMAQAVEQTVKSLQRDEPVGLPNTERISGANVVNMSIINDVIHATVQIHPVEAQPGVDLLFNLPIIRRK